MIQEKLRDSSSRLAGDAGTVPNVHVGGQQHPSPLARWSLRMKLVLVSDGKARAAGSRWHWGRTADAGSSDAKPFAIYLSSLELF